MAEEDNKLIKSVTEDKMSIKQKQAKTVALKHRIVRFKGSVIYRTNAGWEPLSSDEFARMCYTELGPGVRQTQIKDLQHLFFTHSDDLTDKAHYIAFPNGKVWNMKRLEVTTQISPEDCIYTTAISPTKGNSHRKWLEEVAGGDEGVANDIIQALAPVFMYKKPFGVFWFLGNGANGKSTVLKSLYAIFGSEAPYSHNRWFSQLTVKQIEDERDIPVINGKIANICLESNDGHIKDTGGYKNLAEHSTFNVHKFNSQDGVNIDGNVHTIFNANNIPTFADKTQGVRRRTFTIPFKASFEQDNTFDEKLFGQDEFLSDLLGEILETTKVLRKNGYDYKFSDTTLVAKQDYDEEVNTAETYFEEQVAQEIWGFNNFIDLNKDYNAWCDERSLSALGKKSIAHAAKAFGYERKTFRTGTKVSSKYVLGADITLDDIREVPHRWGIWQKADSDIDLVTQEDKVDKHYNAMLELL